MAEVSLEKLSELLQAELKSEELQRIPKSIYKDVASVMKSMRNEGQREDVMARLKDKEAKLLYSFITRLLEARIDKASKLPEDKLDEGRLCAEEKYILEALNESELRLKRVKQAVQDGKPKLLNKLSDLVLSRKVVVRFLQPMPSIVGVDLKRYGPFQSGDVAALPLENVKPLIKRGVVEEVWTEDRV